MKARFQDLEDDKNPSNGRWISDEQQALALLDAVHDRPPFMAQFTSENGFNITVGIANEFGCVQYAASDGSPPFLMAITTTSTSELPDRHDMEFLVGGTPTPIESRYRLPLGLVKQVVADFIVSGNLSKRVGWEKF